MTLTAGFTDPDSRITGYDWDLDGNGTIDRSTDGPTTVTSYGAPGSYSPRVLAKDFRGGSGRATANVLVTGSTPPPVSRRPVLSLPSFGRVNRTLFRVTCDSRCGGRATLTVSRKTARKLGLSRRRVGSKAVRLAAAGQRRIRITVSRATVRRMRREGVRRITATLRVTVTDAEGQRRIATRRVSLRR